MSDNVKAIIHSTGLWFAVALSGALLFLIFGLRPCLHLLGALFELLGGPGTAGTGL